MLRLTRNREFKVSNRVAVFAALMLTVISLAGAGSSTAIPESQSVNFADTNAVESTTESVRSRSSSAVKKNKGFKVSLFLFRNN